jgi:hypothetical protein
VANCVANGRKEHLEDLNAVGQIVPRLTRPPGLCVRAPTSPCPTHTVAVGCSDDVCGGSPSFGVGLLVMSGCHSSEVHFVQPASVLASTHWVVMFSCAFLAIGAIGSHILCLDVRGDTSWFS